MADATAQAKEQVKKGAEAKQRSVDDAYEKASYRPTPTQAENDLVKSGVPVETHEPDGSPEHDQGSGDQRKHQEASKPSGYQTRAHTPAPPKS